MISNLGRLALGPITGLGNFALFVTRAIRAMPHARGLGFRWVRSIEEQGVRSLPVVVIVGAFTGLVLGLQGYHVMSRFGSESLVGSFVSLTLARELAPVLAALVIVGQAGSALAAELSLQRNSEQIDALETMGVDSVGYLITPRLLAAVVIFPILTVFFTLIGVVGGFVSASVMMGLDGPTYWTAARDALRPEDMIECLLKAFVFGAAAIAICAHTGFTTHRRTKVAGARAVSASTTRAVVFASITVLAADFLLTSLLT